MGVHIIVDSSTDVGEAFRSRVEAVPPYIALWGIGIL